MKKKLFSHSQTSKTSHLDQQDRVIPENSSACCSHIEAWDHCTLICISSFLVKWSYFHIKEIVAPNLSLHLLILSGTNQSVFFFAAAFSPLSQPPAQASHCCQAICTICPLSVSWWKDRGHLATVKSAQYTEGNQQSSQKAWNKTDLGNPEGWISEKRRLSEAGWALRPWAVL